MRGPALAFEFQLDRRRRTRPRRMRHRALCARTCAARARGALDRAAREGRPALCWIRVPCVSSATAARYQLCGSETGHRLEPSDRADQKAGGLRDERIKGKGCCLVTGERSMRQPNSRRVITRDKYDAVLLDLDGVITITASLHAACWKQTFDEYLEKRAAQRGEAFRPFDLATD